MRSFKGRFIIPRLGGRHLLGGWCNIFNSTRRGGGEKFATRREGGVVKFSTWPFIFNSPNSIFSCVFMGFGVFSNFRSKGGGRKIFNASRRGGRKIFNLTYFFQLTKIQCFLVFICVLGNFQFLGQRGGENFSTAREGGAKNFQRVLKGGRKIFNRRFFGILG